jgi:REP-associated tyrosine transposase
MNYVNSNVAREAGRLHDWKEKFWGRRYRAIPILDEVAQVDRLHYLLSHGCKEGLTDHPRVWPGVSSFDAMLRDESTRGSG